MRVIWTRAAGREVDRVFDYLVDLNPRAAGQVEDALRKAGNSLAHFPRRGRRVPGTDIRELVTDYSYIIRYEFVEDTVVILGVRHTSRPPTCP